MKNVKSNPKSKKRPAKRPNPNAAKRSADAPAPSITAPRPKPKQTQAKRPQTAQPKPAQKPMSRSARNVFVWHCAIVLCVCLSLFAVLFASCSSGEALPDEGEVVSDTVAE